MNHKSRATPSEIYPRYCFDLAPTHNKWCFLRAVDIQKLIQPDGFEGQVMHSLSLYAFKLISEKGQDWYFYANLPVRWVRIVGIVVAIDQFQQRRVYTIDDSSGACIEATITGTFSTANNNPTEAPGKLNTAASEKLRELDGTLRERDTALGGPKLLFPYEGLDVGAVVDIKGGLTTFRDEKQINIDKLVTIKSTAQEVALWEKRAEFHKSVLSRPWTLSTELVRKCRKQAERSEEQAERRKKRLRSRADQEAAVDMERSNKVQKQAKRQRSGLQRSEVAMMIHSGGIKGKFSALGL
jgi:hypothetical protein